MNIEQLQPFVAELAERCRTLSGTEPDVLQMRPAVKFSAAVSCSNKSRDLAARLGVPSVCVVDEPPFLPGAALRLCPPSHFGT